MITLADCRMSKPEWSSFYKSFGNGLKSPNLVSFVWIDNPIHNHLFSFLSHTSIKFLSLAGFRSMDKSYLGYLESANLEAIDLHGTRRKRVREIDDVMLALSKNRSISMIDISNNRINDNNLPMLLKMLNSVKNYAEIIFDGNDFSVEMLTKITQVLDQRANLLVHFPAVSVSKLSEVSEQTMVNLKKKFRGIQKAFVRKTFYDDLWKMLIAREYPFENNETFVEEQPQSFSEKSSSLKSVEIKPKLDEISWEIEFVEPMFDDFSLKEELKNQFTFEKCKERLSASKK
ncbi:hypothetical protein GPJ56_011012 [Histomonas meleagridis]|uniref:Leucine Rich Repeat family protein n=1 Tax=Histomonas meleagridis TaxID=135588 RepID=UPI003559651F|nr:hypothetical protein GPJ56_011012 [Histomonas meleagridis]KAH0800789.1 Leucine Rich Repeat family protein [Histomonas meleagridis]